MSGAKGRGASPESADAETLQDKPEAATRIERPPQRKDDNESPGRPSSQAPGRLAESGAPDALTGREVEDYLLGPVIGSGGMGVIYSAVDTKLHRRVAIKVIRPQSADEDAEHATSRLVREAQAMARLSHPNVVTIYQVGRIDDRVFVAMEFIDGQTLKSWLAETKPSWRQALDVMLQAGRGLEAAHAAGLIHRDFKPDNVLIRRDGRALVTDFGLARTDEASDSTTSRSMARVASKLTMTGAVMGTPMYMSPEQHAGRPTDARTDQYSYALTLYEAVYGRHPLSTGPRDELVAAKSERKIPPSPTGTRVPRWLRSIIMRGLAAEVDERFPSMREMLARIERRRARRRDLVVAAIGAMIVVGVIAAQLARSRPAAVSCSGGATQIAAIWNAPRTQAVQGAFRATGQPFAEPTFEFARHALDDYANKWATMHRDACEATHVRHEQSEVLLDARMACLGQRAQELHAIVDLFATADAGVVTRAGDAVRRLSPIEDCAATAAMRAAATERLTPADRSERQRLSTDLAKAKALASSTRSTEASGLVKGVIADAHRSGAASVEAEAILLEAGLQVDAGQFADAKKTLINAVETAERAQDLALRATALIKLVNIDGVELHKLAEAHVWDELATAVLARADDVDLLKARLLSEEGSVFFEEENYEAALRVAQQALAIQRQKLGPDHLELAETNDYIGAILVRLGRAAEAIPYHRTAIALHERLGETHLDVADSANHLGNALASSGDLAGAEQQYRRAIEIWRQSVGEEHGRVALGHTNLASLALLREDPRAALDEFTAALAVEEANHGTAPSAIAETLTSIGTTNLALDDRTHATDALERALSIWNTLPDAPVERARTQFALARALWPTNHSRALDLANAARDRMGTAGPSWHDDLDEVENWLAKRRSKT